MSRLALLTLVNFLLPYRVQTNSSIPEFMASSKFSWSPSRLKHSTNLLFLTIISRGRTLPFFKKLAVKSHLAKAWKPGRADSNSFATYCDISSVLATTLLSVGGWPILGMCSTFRSGRVSSVSRALQPVHMGTSDWKEWLSSQMTLRNTSCGGLDNAVISDLKDVIFAIFSRPLQCNVRLLSWDVVCLSVVCNTRVLWPNGWTDQDEP